MGSSDFEGFAPSAERALRAGLVAAYGPEIGPEVTAEAMAYAWSNLSRLRSMTNPAGYLYRVGQSASRRYLRPAVYLPAANGPGDRWRGQRQQGHHREPLLLTSPLEVDG